MKKSFICMDCFASFVTDSFHKNEEFCPECFSPIIVNEVIAKQGRKFKVKNKLNLQGGTNDISRA